MPFRIGTELVDPAARLFVEKTISDAGYHTHVRDGLAYIRRSGRFKIVHDLYKVFRHSESTGRYSVCAVPSGMPCLMVFTRLMGEPWCVVVPKRYDANKHAAARMYLTRGRFRDETLFDGTVLEVTCDHHTLMVFDAMVYKGRSLYHTQFARRFELVLELVNVQHRPDECDRVNIVHAPMHHDLDNNALTRMRNVQDQPQQRLYIATGTHTWLLI
jgi:hypothetical protein